MLLVAPTFKPVFKDLELTSFKAVQRFFLGDDPTNSRQVILKKSLLPRGLSVFFKQYTHRGSLRFLTRASKARREFENYDAFLKLEIPCAQPVACGEERDALGRLLRAFIITREISNAQPLPEFFEARCSNRKQRESREFRKRLLEQLAEIARKLHAAKFFHNDFVWRNILATPTSANEAKLWLIDCPRGKFDRWSFLRHHRAVKDLAALDKTASRLCTRGERLVFLKNYLGKTRLDSEIKNLAQQIVAYRKRRWTDD